MDHTINSFLKTSSWQTDFFPCKINKVFFSDNARSKVIDRGVVLEIKGKFPFLFGKVRANARKPLEIL